MGGWGDEIKRKHILVDGTKLGNTKKGGSITSVLTESEKGEKLRKGKKTPRD